MTTVLPRSSQEQQDTSACASFSSFPDLSSLSTLWVPLHEVRQQWATFGQEVLTPSALMATSTAFGGLYWETHALQHSTWRARAWDGAPSHQTTYGPGQASQALHVALSQGRQEVGGLILPATAHRRQIPQT